MNSLVVWKVASTNQCFDTLALSINALWDHIKYSHGIGFDLIDTNIIGFPWSHNIKSPFTFSIFFKGLNLVNLNEWDFQLLIILLIVLSFKLNLKLFLLYISSDSFLKSCLL